MYLFLRKKTFFGLLVFSFSFLIYFLTLAPSISPGDGPELITAAYNLGTAHPPGYPLLTLISKFFITIFPFGNIAWRVNLLNAIFGALTVLVVYFIIYKLTPLEIAKTEKKPKANKSLTGLTKRIIPAVAGSLFLAFSSGFWLYSITAEVFSLNNLFGALLILIILTWREKVLKGEDKSQRWLYLFSFLAGLSFTNQQAIIFLLPAFLFLIFTSHPPLFIKKWGVGSLPSYFFKNKGYIKWKTLLLAALFLILGLTPYLYLLIASSSGTGFYWADPSSLKNLIRVFLRKEYLGLSYHTPALSALLINWKEILLFYFKSLYFQFTIVGVLLGIIGLASLWQRKKIFIFLLLSFLSSGLLFLFYLSNLKLEVPVMAAVAERFTLLSGVVFSIWIGRGVYSPLSFLKAGGKFLIPAFCLFCFLIPLFIHYPFVDQSKNYLLNDLGEDVLNSLDREGLLITKGDMMFFSVFYLQEVEKKRPDIKIIYQPFLVTDWYTNYLRKKYPEITIPFDRIKRGDDKIEKMKELIGANIAQRAIYYPIIEEAENLNLVRDSKNEKDIQNRDISNGAKEDYFLVPKDFLFQILKDKSEFNQEEYIRENENFSKNSKLVKNPLLYQTRFNKKFPFSVWDEGISQVYAISQYNKCSFLYGLKFYQAAEKECLTALSVNPDFSQAYFILGNIAFQKKLYKKAAEVYEKVIQIEPQNLSAYQNLIVIYKDFLKDEKRASKYLREYEIQKWLQED